MRRLLVLFVLLTAANVPAQAAVPQAHVLVFTMAGGCGYAPSGTYFPGGCVALRGQTVQFPLIVPRGANLTFVNIDAGLQAHSLTSGTCVASTCTANGLFDSSIVGPRQSAEVRVSDLTAADYPFFCSLHYFTGMLTIQNVP